MSKLLNALKRTLRRRPTREPDVHFHQGTTDDSPEVCYDGACQRPQLSA